MIKFFKKIPVLPAILIQAGIVLLITGSIFDLLNTPGSEIYVRMGVVSAGLLSLIAFVDIWLSKSISVSAKIIWIFGLIFFNILATLLFFFKRNISGNRSSSHNHGEVF